MEIESERTTSTDATRDVLPPPVVAERSVVEMPAERVLVPAPAAVHAESVRTVRTTGMVPAAVVAGAAAVVLLVLGGVTVARAGLDGSLDTPVVTVAGFTATAALGLVEFGFGVVLLLAALARSVATILFLAIVGGVAGLIAVIQPSAGRGTFAVERAFAGWTVVAMAIVVASTMLPSVRHSSTRHTADVA